VLFLESTCGDTDTHPSFTNAQTTLWEEICAAVRRDIPVLLPTFGVGRAQELLQMFTDRIRSQQAPADVIEKMDIIYDGMVTDSMQIYHAFVRNEWLSEVIRETEPDLPDVEFTVEEDVHTLLFIGGTTGLPKGCLLIHRNIVANALQSIAAQSQMAQLMRGSEAARERT
jgi:Cft2 family RNA processing exonuclease